MNAPQGRRGTVLIVDNNDHELTFLETLAKNEGFDSRATWSGHEALALIESRHFDIVLVNDHLPDLYYGDFLKRASRQLPHPYIVVMQKGKPSPGAMRRHKALGVAAVIDKKDIAQIRRILAARHSSSSMVIAAQP